MALVNVNKFCLDMEIPEVSKLDKIYSPEIPIHGIPWKVKIYKKRRSEGESLSVYLHCANKDKSPNWSLWGLASFKLLPFTDDGNPIEHQILPYVFDASGIGHGKSNFIKWNDLFNVDNKYVKDDKINFEIKVTAENPHDPNRSRLNFVCTERCCDNGYFAAFRLTVNNILNLMALQSPKFTLRGIPWYLQISKSRSSHLGVLLHLKEDLAKQDKPSKMTMTIKLISSKKDVQSIEKSASKQQFQYSGNVLHLEIIAWDELVKPENGFVNNNSITMEVKMQANEPEDETPTPAAKRAKLNAQNDDEVLKLECPICLKCIHCQDLAATTCGHMFCFECIKKAITTRAACPVCNKAVRSYGLRQIYLPSVN